MGILRWVRKRVVKAVDARWGQPRPVQNESRPVWALVIEDMIARDNFGRAKYGTPLQAFNGRKVILDIYEEALDFIVYLRQMIEENFAGEPLFSESTPPLIRVRTPDLARVLAENMRLSERVDELLAQATRYVEERRARDVNQQVREFFAVAEQSVGLRPHVPSDETVRFRMRLVSEEFVELLRATFNDAKSTRAAGVLSMERDLIADLERTLKTIVDYAAVEVDLPELADACADLDYVNAGVRVAFGIDGGPIAKLVHDANMAKRGGPKREGDGKRMKPPGWTPPDIAAELRRQGWPGDREVVGVVLSPNVTTAEGWTLTEEEIERTAAAYLASKPTLGWGTLVDSYVTKVDDGGVPKGSWVVRVRATKEAWEKVRSGAGTFSIGPSVPLVRPEAVAP